MVASAASPTDSASPDTIPIHVHNQNQVTYQEEMCEKLIQLSFVKIVSSKNERGGARLRKNLLILHLLQKARLEQRNRLFAAAAARNMVVNQRTVPVVSPEADSPKTIDHVEENEDSEVEKIDTDASYSQQEPPTRPDQGQTFEGMSPECHKHKDISHQPNCTCQVYASTCEGEETEVETEHPTSHNSDNKTMNRRACLKRKHDSMETSSNQHDRNSSSPKMACVIRHFYKTTAPSSNEENEGQGQTVAPLARSLSCSSFMELTCES